MLIVLWGKSQPSRVAGHFGGKGGKLSTRGDLWESQTRRQFLRTGTAALLSLGTGCVISEVPSGAPLSRAASSSGLAGAAIDIHCHIFNARDLPIRKFVRNVVFEKKPVGVVLDPLVSFLSLIMDQESPTATDELAVLSTLGARPSAAAPGPGGLAGNRERKRQMVTKALDRLRRGEPGAPAAAPFGRSAAGSVSSAPANAQFFDQLRARYGGAQPSAAPPSPCRTRSPNSKPSSKGSSGPTINYRMMSSGPTDTRFIDTRSSTC